MYRGIDREREVIQTERSKKRERERNKEDRQTE